jgi:hypothetical protein
MTQLRLGNIRSAALVKCVSFTDHALLVTQRRDRFDEQFVGPDVERGDQGEKRRRVPIERTRFTGDGSGRGRGVGGKSGRLGFSTSWPYPPIAVAS